MRPSPFPYAAALLGALATSLAMIACDSTPGAESADSAKSSLVGNPAPEFSVDVLNASKGKFALTSKKGKVILLDVWATWCAPCKSSFPKLQDLYTKYKASGLEIIGISQDEDVTNDKIVSFADENGAKFPVGLDKEHAIAKKYAVGESSMPTSFLIDSKGVVRFMHVGFHDGEEKDIDKEIKQLLDEK